MQGLMEFSQTNDVTPQEAVARLSQGAPDGGNNQMQQQQQMQQHQQQQGMMGTPQQQAMGQPQGNPMMQQPNHAQMALQRNGIVQGMPPGSHTPNQNHMQLPQQGNPNFSSPSISSIGLPIHMTNGMMNGSPHIGQHPGLPQQHPGMQHMQHLQMMQMQQNHTPSPAQSHMAAPSMIPQHSQQGTNSNASNVNSANTSPQVNNKRRRSQVKMEMDGMGDGEPVPQRVKPSVKPSPRIGGPKKGK